MATVGSGSVNADNIKLEPMDLYFGSRNRDCITVIALPDGDYFDFERVAFDGTKTLYRAWYDLNAVSTPPAAGGRTLVEIDIITADSFASIATKSAVVLNALAGVASKAVADVFWIQNHVQAGQIAAVDGNTTFTFLNQVAGASEYLGGTNGATEVSFDGVATVDIKANQTGDILLAQLVTSVGASISASILELTKERYKSLIGNVLGGALTPAGGTEIIGLGSNSIGKNLLTVGKELLMKPVNSGVDHTRNITFFKSAPVPNSASYSGVEPSALEFSFTAYLDNSVDSKINLWAFGDTHQDIWV